MHYRVRGAFTQIELVPTLGLLLEIDLRLGVGVRVKVGVRKGIGGCMGGCMGGGMGGGTGGGMGGCMGGGRATPVLVLPMQQVVHFIGDHNRIMILIIIGSLFGEG